MNQGRIWRIVDSRKAIFLYRHCEGDLSHEAIHKRFVSVPLFVILSVAFMRSEVSKSRESKKIVESMTQKRIYPASSLRVSETSEAIQKIKSIFKKIFSESKLQFKIYKLKRQNLIDANKSTICILQINLNSFNVVSGSVVNLGSDL